MAILKTSFIILTSIFNNLLYTNVPHEVNNVAVCFNDIKEDCIRSSWKLMGRTKLNDERLQVFYAMIPSTNNTYYKLKLIYPDGTEGDQANWQNTFSDYLQKIYPNDTTTKNSSSSGSNCHWIESNMSAKIYRLYLISCVTMLLILIMIIKIIIKTIKQKL